MAPASKGTVELVLPSALEHAIALGHPWVYRDHIPRGFEAPSGTWVLIRAGRAQRFGLWDERSPIAVRLFSSIKCPDAHWVKARVDEALDHRELSVPTGTNTYRLIYGEGDQLPGVTVDRYGDYVVIVTYADCLRGLVPLVAEAVAQRLAPRGILWRRSDEQKKGALELLRGDRPPANLVIEERGLKFYADLEVGQKTGLFIDQRENRHFLAPFVRNRTVLNLFCYTGGFSVVAAAYGATATTSVDISAPAVRRVRDNLELNGIDPATHELVTEDCYLYLEAQVKQARSFDVVICDPPSLARNRAQLEGALKAYTLLNARGIQCVKPGGYYVAASCTSQVSPEAFRGVLAESARRAKRHLQLVQELGHAVDHPQALGHPEGRYLKFLVLRVLSQS